MANEEHTLTVDGKHNQRVEMAVVSWGESCCSRGRMRMRRKNDVCSSYMMVYWGIYKSKMSGAEQLKVMLKSQAKDTSIL